MNLSPEQFASLRRVLAAPAAKAAALTMLAPDLLESVFSKIEVFVKSCAASFGDSKILLHHVHGQGGGHVLTSALVDELILARNFIVAIGDDGTLITSDSGVPSLVTASEESEASSSVCALCCRENIILFAAGKIIAEIGLARMALF